MRRHLPFVIILAGTTIVRFALLLVSQTHLTSDEAIIGLMGKHILEGRYFPFYFYGISYNASCAWEAYLAVIPFAIVGVSVIALKIPTVLLSLACLALFYAMTTRLYSTRVATLASLIFALWPGLAKWHYQPRGYAFYFLFVPLLVILFLVVEKQETRRARDFFLFGLACGIALWGMELLLITIVALWLLLLLRRGFSTFAVVLGGFVIGYAPAIWWNLSHSFANWHFLFFEKPEAGGLAARFGLSAWREIFLHEMPKFFSVDTVLWYYPETPWLGYVLYLVTATALIAAGWSALRWTGVRNAFTSGFSAANASRDLLMLLLIGISFIPYIIAPLRVPGYFLGATFFISTLIARLVDSLFARKTALARTAGAVVLLAVIVCGLEAIVETGAHNQIETLALSPNRHDLHMVRIPGRDIDAIKADLAGSNINAVWASFSLVYPLIFETGEKLVASESIFGIDRPVYPPQIPKPEPTGQDRSVFVIETDSPYRAEIETTCQQKGGAPPRVTEHGALTVIEERLAANPP